MAYIYVPFDQLPRSFLWEDGNVYAPRKGATGEVPDDMTLILVKLGTLPKDQLPDGVDPNEIVIDQTQLAAQGWSEDSPDVRNVYQRDEGNPEVNLPPGAPAPDGAQPLQGENADLAAAMEKIAAQGAPADVPPHAQPPVAPTDVPPQAQPPTDGGAAATAPPVVTDGGDPEKLADLGQMPAAGEQQYTSDDEMPGVFPARTELNEAGYTTIGQVQLIDLEKVTGIGPVTAQKITAWIAENVA